MAYTAASISEEYINQAQDWPPNTNIPPKAGGTAEVSIWLRSRKRGVLFGAILPRSQLLSAGMDTLFSSVAFLPCSPCSTKEPCLPCLPVPGLLSLGPAQPVLALFSSNVSPPFEGHLQVPFLQRLWRAVSGLTSHVGGWCSTSLRLEVGCHAVGTRHCALLGTMRRNHTGILSFLHSDGSSSCQFESHFPEEKLMILI